MKPYSKNHLHIYINKQYNLSFTFYFIFLRFSSVNKNEVFDTLYFKYNSINTRKNIKT